MEFVGLIFILWLGYMLIKGYSKAKARRYHAVVARARRGLTENQEVPRPAWIYDRDKLGEFFDVVRALCIKYGVSESYLDEVLPNQDFHRMVLIKFVSILEQNNMSFTSQKVATSELIRDLWNSGVEIPPANLNLQKIINFLDSKIFSSFDASAIATNLYLGANFDHAVNMYQNPNAVTFEKKYGHTISNDAKPFFDKIDVMNGAKYMDANYSTCSIDLNEISAFVSSFSDNRSSDKIALKLLTAEYIIKNWKLR